MDKMSLITLLGGFSSTGNGAAGSTAGSTGTGENLFAKACAPCHRQLTSEFRLKVGQIGIDREWRVG
jgi:mono/diheme cytochrome c family protein